MKMLSLRKREKLSQLKRINQLLAQVSTLPRVPALTKRGRERRYLRVLAMRDGGKTYREIGSRLNVSATRAQRLYDDAINWRKRRVR